MRSLCFTGVVMLSLAGCSAKPSVDYDPDGPVVSINDFTVIEGEAWEGSLTYLDYSADKRVTIPTNVKVSIASATSLKYSISYPKEPWEDTKEKLTISKSGRLLDGYPVTYREKLPNGSLEIRTLHAGDDNGAPAQIRMVYRLSASDFSISKDVREEGAKTFINRNIYSFTRP